MKHAQKIATLLLALVMVFAMSVTVFAADPDYSITVNNAVAGETYTAYKMFDLSVDDPTNPTAYRYTVNSAWANFANTDEFKAVFTVDAQGYVTANTGITDESTWTSSGKMSVLAEKAAAYAKTNSISAAGSVTIAEGATSGTIALTDAGYYVVSSTLGSRAMIETTPASSAVTIIEKNEGDTITKTVKEDSTGNYGDSNDAQIGDTVEFKSVASIAARSINVKIHDTMEAGLTLNANSIKVYTDEGLTTEYTGATVRASTGDQAPDTGDTFTIDIPDAFAATADQSQNLYIVYTAELNKNAIATTPGVDDQVNKIVINYGDKQSMEATTTTTTHSATIFKHAANSEDNLANAIFTLKKGDTVVNLVKLDATNYRVVDDTETDTASSHVAKDGDGNATGEVAEIVANSIVSDFVTVSTGKITIWGLDSDSDYTITELQAPKGYNLLAEPVTLTYITGAEEGTTAGFAEANITNQTGTELPSTGGIGTTIFYVLGSVLVLTAIVLLVTKKRMSAKA